MSELMASANAERLNQTWTPEEEDYLLAHAATMDHAELAEKLGRPLEAMRTKLKRLRSAGRRPEVNIGAGWESFREAHKRTRRSRTWFTRRVNMELIRTRWMRDGGQGRLYYWAEDVDREHAKPNLSFANVTGTQGSRRRPKTPRRVPRHLRGEFMAFVRMAERDVRARLRREYLERKCEVERRAG